MQTYAHWKFTEKQSINFSGLPQLMHLGRRGKPNTMYVFGYSPRVIRLNGSIDIMDTKIIVTMSYLR